MPLDSKRATKSSAFGRFQVWRKVWGWGFPEGVTSWVFYWLWFCLLMYPPYLEWDLAQSRSLVILYWWISHSLILSQQSKGNNTNLEEPDTSPSALGRARIYFLENCGMCPWGPKRAEGRCSRPVTIAWCSPCNSCCCPMTSLSIPSQSYSAWLLSSSWCSSCEFSGWDWEA